MGSTLGGDTQGHGGTWGRPTAVQGAGRGILRFEQGAGRVGDRCATGAAP